MSLLLVLSEIGPNTSPPGFSLLTCLKFRVSILCSFDGLQLWSRWKACPCACTPLSVDAFEAQGRLPFPQVPLEKPVEERLVEQRWQGHEVSTASSARPLPGEAERHSQPFGLADREIWKCSEKDFVECTLIQEVSRYSSAESLSGEKELPCKSTDVGGETDSHSPLLSFFHLAKLRMCISSLYSIYCSSWHSNKTDFLRRLGSRSWHFFPKRCVDLRSATVLKEWKN